MCDNKTYRNLKHFLKEHSVKKGSNNFTHSSMTGGLYNIDNIDIFLEHYSNSLRNNEDLYITEKHIKDNSILLIDLDFRFDNIDERAYSLNIIIDFCNEIKDYILNTFEVSNDKLDYYIFQRPNFYKKGSYIKDGIHIIFPHIITNYWFQYYLRIKMMNYLNLILKDLDLKNTIDDIYDEAVIERNNWTLFGSTKKNIEPYRLVYVSSNDKKIKKKILKGLNQIPKISENNITTNITEIDTDSGIINNIDNNTVLDNQVLNNLELCEDYDNINPNIIHKYLDNSNNKFVKKYGILPKYILYFAKLFCIRNKETNTVLEFKNTEYAKSIKEEYEQSLLKSVNSKSKFKKNILNGANNNLQCSNLNNINKEKNISNDITDDEIKAISNFIENNKSSWSKTKINVENIKKIIYSDDFNPHYFVRFNHPDPNEKLSCPFKGEPHNRDTCPVYLHIWKGGAVMKCNDDGDLCRGKTYPEKPIPIPMNIQNIIFNNLTIVNYNEEDHTLFEFEQDIKYIKAFDDEELNILTLNSLNGTHYDIAKLLYHLYNDDFRCISMEGKNNWYEFVNHRWVVGSMKLRQNISEELTKVYLNVKKQYIHNCNNITEGSKKEKMINNLIKKLKTTSFKNNIMSECCEIFYANNDDFLNKVDENKFLIGFENGVYNLETMTFTDGKPEDNVSISTGYDFIPTYSENKKDLLDFLASIQPDHSEREYLLKFLASCLNGRNPEELFHIFTGRTRNGKSKLRDLIKNTFGGYYNSINSNLLTRERPGPGNPQPDIMGLKGNRIIIGSEPEKGQKINTGFMKFLTGNDPIKGRGLYEKTEVEYNPQFKVILLCNDIPDMDNNDEGVWSRCRCIEYPVTFVKNPTETYERLIDVDLGTKLVKWTNDFFLLLLEYYEKYNNEGLIPTQKIKDFTYEYRIDTDRYLSYLKERTVKEKGVNVHISELYEDFKMWFKSNNPHEKIPISKVFNNSIKKYVLFDRSVRVGKKVSTGIKNLRLVEDEYSSDED